MDTLGGYLGICGLRGFLRGVPFCGQKLFVIEFWGAAALVKAPLPYNAWGDLMGFGQSIYIEL